MTSPGIGPITALTYRATIDRPERFCRIARRRRALGLTPSRYQSGETDIVGKISRCGDELARTALYEAAHTLLVRSTQVVEPARLGTGRRQAPRHGQGQGCGRPKARRHPAPHVERRHRLPLRQGGRGLRRRTSNDEHPFARKGEAARPCGDDGRGDLVENPEPLAPTQKVVDRLRRPALLTPSCGASQQPKWAREEKRVTRRSEPSQPWEKETEQLDTNDPNQRRLLRRNSSGNHKTAQTPLVCSKGGSNDV